MGVCPVLRVRGAAPRESVRHTPKAHTSKSTSESSE